MISNWAHINTDSGKLIQQPELCIKLQKNISDGLNQKKQPHRTILVAIDLSKAFDTVNHYILLQDIPATTIPNNYKRWITNYLRGRSTFVEFRNHKSNFRNLKQGVLQGGVLSPMLFNIYMSHLPPPPSGIEIISYEDDCTVMISGTNIPNMCDNINFYLDELNVWFNDMNLLSLSTTWKHQVKWQSSSFNNQVKVLGVTFDQALIFNSHAVSVRNKMSSRNKVLKSLAGSDWGNEKEVLLMTYIYGDRPFNSKLCSYRLDTDVDRYQLEENPNCTECSTQSGSWLPYHGESGPPASGDINSSCERTQSAVVQAISLSLLCADTSKPQP